MEAGVADGTRDQTAGHGRALVYPLATTPAFGEAVTVAPGVLWMRMPLDGPIGFINVWALRDKAGWALVDTGMQTEQTTGAWRKVLAGPLGGDPITRVIVTHLHPDHVGMAGWLTRKFDCRLWMTRLEYLQCRMLVEDTGRQVRPTTPSVSIARPAGTMRRSTTTKPALAASANASTSCPILTDAWSMAR